MKILILILAIVGGIISWTSKQIAEYIWKDKEVSDEQKICVKLAGLVLVVIAVLVALCT